MKSLRWIPVWAAVLAVGALPLPAHEHHPPHHGSLQVLGDDFAHLEFVLDPKAGVLTAYALDGEAEESVRLVQRSIRLDGFLEPGHRRVRLVLRAVANVLSGETVGDTSQFEARSPLLVGCAGLDGRLKRVEIRGALFENVRVRHPGGNETGDKP